MSLSKAIGRAEKLVAQVEAKTGRSDGRFAKGNSGGPGNPFNATVQKLRAAMVQAVSPEDIGEVIGQVLTQAKDGNLAAIKLLLSYTIGQPHQTIQPDRAELDEAEIRNKTELNRELIAQRARLASIYGRDN
jgi:hypothetical protein